MPSQVDARGYPCRYIAGEFQSVAIMSLPREATPFRRAQLLDVYLADGYALTSGHDLERDTCDTCSLCFPLRYPVQAFVASRDQEKMWDTNSDLHVQDDPDVLSTREMAEHIALCDAYQKNRYRPDYDAEKAEAIVVGPTRVAGGVKIGFLSVRDKRTNRLVGGLQYAQGANSLYGMHYYYDTAMMDRTLGKFMILSLIELAKMQQRQYVYAGAWIPEFKHFATKTQFQPYEILVNGQWQRYKTSQPFDRASAPSRLVPTS